MFNVQLYRPATSHDMLAREIAERSVAAALQNLGPRRDTLSGAELRGYVRAHTFPCVHDEALQLVGREWPQSALNNLLSTALEQATHRVLRQLKSQPVASIPLPHVRRRIAA